MVNGYLLALAAVVVYGLVVYALYRAGRIGRDRALSLFGPALMIKTRRGRGFLERVGRFRRFWSAMGDIGVGLAATAMAGIVVLLIIGDVAATHLSAAQAPSATEALVLPGINPIIPIGYGLVALIIGVVLHELLHGVLARSQKIGVKSIGILWCVVPVGAFVEQDDEEMAGAGRRRRDRVAAAGIFANFVLALVFFVALSAVVSYGATPAANGVGVALVVSSSPAANASIAPGDILTAINHTALGSADQFASVLHATHPGQVVPVDFYAPSVGTVSRSVTLARSPSNCTCGFLGVRVYGLTPSQYLTTLATPWANSGGPVSGVVTWMLLPFAGLQPAPSPVTNFYHLAGGFGVGGGTVFWVVTNGLYWLAWMNLLLGASNALPLVPLDGGLLARDFASGLAARLRPHWSAEQAERIGGRAVALSSALVLVLIVWQFVVPRFG